MLSALNMFVINLDHTPERMREFQQINAHLPNVTRFPAIDGKSVGHKTLIERGIFAPPIFYKDGSVGNTLSHRELWMMAAERGEIITAFEDDAIIHKDFETLAPAMIAKLRPDWDMVVWGWNFDAALSFDLFPSVPCLAHFSQADMRNQWEAIQKDAIQPSLHRHHYAFGTIAYSVSPAGAKRIAALAFPIRPFLHQLPRHNIEVENLTVDCVLSTLFDRLNVYVCIPPLVLTKNDHAASTVQVGWHGRPFARIRRLKQRLSGMSPLPQDDNGFRLTPSAHYPNSREFTRKFAHYLYKNGDKLGAARKYLKHLCMRR